MAAKDQETYIKRLGSLGYCWQFITLAGLHQTALISNAFSKAYSQRGMRAYGELVQEPEMEQGVEVVKHQKWSGANYVDELLKMVSGGVSSTAAMGSGVTEVGYHASRSQILLTLFRTNSNRQLESLDTMHLDMMLVVRPSKRRSHELPSETNCILMYKMYLSHEYLPFQATCMHYKAPYQSTIEVPRSNDDYADDILIRGSAHSLDFKDRILDMFCF